MSSTMDGVAAATRVLTRRPELRVVRVEGLARISCFEARVDVTSAVGAVRAAAVGGQSEGPWATHLHPEFRAVVLDLIALAIGRGEFHLRALDVRLSEPDESLWAAGCGSDQRHQGNTD